AAANRDRATLSILDLPTILVGYLAVCVARGRRLAGQGQSFPLIHSTCRRANHAAWRRRRWTVLTTANTDVGDEAVLAAYTIELLAGKIENRNAEERSRAPDHPC